MIVPEIVTLDEVYRHLQRPASPDGSPSQADLDLQQKLDAATELICEHIADRNPPDDAWVATIEAWTVDTAPQQVREAVIAHVAYHDLNRDGAPNDGRPTDPGFLPPIVRNLLVRYRTPALA
jgi:hypothetical protein